MSWKYFTGDITSRAVHLYRYPDVSSNEIITQNYINVQRTRGHFFTLQYNILKGWDSLDKTRQLKRSSEKLVEARQYGKTLINQKQSEQLKSFIFWPSPDKRPGESIYEISCYDLVPGNKRKFNIFSYHFNISQKYMIYCHRINRCFILGSMKDWSNYWKKGVQCRQNVREDIPYAGFFTQLGHIHRIYHIWLVFTSFDNA